MDAHKKRIAELQVLREQIAKSKTIPNAPAQVPPTLTPHPYSNTTANHSHRVTGQIDSKGHDTSVNGKSRVDTKKPNSVHHIALGLLTGPTDQPAKSPPHNPISKSQSHIHKNPEPIKSESTFESSRKDPVHRKLQSTVKLLSEALEEAGQLKALLELTMDKHLYDNIMDTWDSLSDKFMRDVKIRALEVEKDHLLHQVCNH